MKALESLLDPVPVERFFREHWDCKPLHVPGPADKFAGLYDAAHWATGWLTDTKAATIDPQGVPVEVPIDPAQSHALFLAGMTICANVSGDPRLAPFLRSFRRDFDLPGGAAFARLYASNDGGGFAIHSDKYHVFVLQMSGKKRWRLSRAPVVPAPLEGARLAPGGRPVLFTGPRMGEPVLDADGAATPPDPAALDTYLLEEGHCLYVPPGFWHVAQAVGHSIAVSVSPPRSSALELFTRLLDDELAGRAAWRRDLLAPPHDPAPPGEVPRSVAAALEARLAELRELLAALDPRSLHNLWRLNVAMGQAPDAVAPTAATEVEIRRSDVLERRGDRPFDFLVAPSPDGEDEILFYAGDSQWNLPLWARAVATELGCHASFRAEEALAWDRTLSFDDLCAILAQLLRAGVLVRRAR